MKPSGAPPTAVTKPLLRVTQGSSSDGPEHASFDLNTPSRVSSLRVERTLRLLAGFGALRRDQLESFLLSDATLTSGSRRVVTHRTLGELRERGLIQEVALPGRPSRASRGYALTEAGHRLYAARDAAYPRRRIRPAPSVVLLDHAAALAEIAIAFRDAALAARDIGLLWESDWEAVARIGSTAAIPDAFVTLERGGWLARAFVEADRSTEWYSAFGNKVRRYVELYRAEEWRAALATWPLVLTVTTSDAHARSLARVAERVARAEGGTRIARAFRCTSLDELHRRGPFGTIWRVGASGEATAIFDPKSAGRLGTLASAPLPAEGEQQCAPLQLIQPNGSR